MDNPRRKDADRPSGLPEDIETVAAELADKAISESLPEEPLPFEEAFGPAVASLLKLVDESFGGHSQDLSLLEYADPGAFAYDYGRVKVFNRLQRPAFEAAPVAERAIFLPHCLRNRKRCEAEEFDLYDRCSGCGACVIANIVALAEGAGYLPERMLIVGGASVIPPMIAEIKPGSVVGVACMDELGMVIEGLAGRPEWPPSQMALLRRRGCRNTRVVLADVKAAL